MITDKKIILASQSPRRQQLLAQLGVDFVSDVRSVNEVYPDNLHREEISEYLAQLKADAFTDLSSKQLVITADTIVWHQQKALGKPQNADEARAMLKSLSGQSHEVITSVCLKTKEQCVVFSDVTQVFFRPLTSSEINYYIDNYQPSDKAGAYGIQEWIGAIGIEKIIGSYTNVMGLPTEKLFRKLQLTPNQLA